MSSAGPKPGLLTCCQSRISGAVDGAIVGMPAGEVVGEAVAVALAVAVGCGDVVVDAGGSVGGRLPPGDADDGAPVGSSMDEIGEVPPGAAIEEGGVVGVEDVQPIRPTTTAMTRPERPREFPMALNLSHGYPRFNWEVPYLWAAIYLEHQPIGQFQNG